MAGDPLHRREVDALVQQVGQHCSASIVGREVIDARLLLSPLHNVADRLPAQPLDPDDTLLIDRAKGRLLLGIELDSARAEPPDN